MNIIIVGCGKVGCTLVEALSSENHNIVVIDSRPEKVSALTDTVDVMGIVGNGVSHTTLKQAGIETADLLIAVTGSDEENLLCCVIAKKSGHCQTIARIRNPIYNEEKDDGLHNAVGSANQSIWITAHDKVVSAGIISSLKLVKEKSGNLVLEVTLDDGKTASFSQ